ncbi:MAG: hypothetical protein MI867_01950, partial [Pseudomonadales bacterium]|nr:hypothetical protein [Pseudomonadales bacterium]
MSVLFVDIAYVRELEKAAQERLKLHIYTLLSVTQLDNEGIWVPEILYNQRFNQRDSGLWAAVFDQEQQVRWHSLSIDTPAALPALATKTGDWRYGKKITQGQLFFTAAYKIEWHDEEQHQFHFVVGEDATVIEQDIENFRWMLFMGFMVITCSLLAGQAFVLKLAFRPISHLETEIAAMDAGEKDKLSNDYPKELRGVTRNLNALIEKEYQQRERYRASMADLAHSLKTPITILNGELAQYPDNKTMRDALARIDSNIEYQLRRAVVTGHTVLNKGTQVNQV